MAAKMKKKGGMMATKKMMPKTVKKSRNSTKPKNDRTLSYTQSEFVENVRQFCGLDKRAQAKEVCGDMQALLVDCLKKGYKIPLLGIGKLYVRRTKARMGRNPATGAPIRIPARKRVRFTPAKALKVAVLN